MRRDVNKQYRYLINTDQDNLEVHDLDNEQTGENECQINDIIKSGNAKYLLIPDNISALKEWITRNPSYDGCKYCLEKEHRK